MKKYKDAIGILKNGLKDHLDRCRKARADILELKYTENGDRRPETGTERHNIHLERATLWRLSARAYHLAYGLLRGKSYRSMERNAKSRPPAGLILNAILLALVDNEELKAEWSITRVLQWVKGQENASQEAA